MMLMKLLDKIEELITVAHSFGISIGFIGQDPDDDFDLDYTEDLALDGNKLCYNKRMIDLNDASGFYIEETDDGQIDTINIQIKDVVNYGITNLDLIA